jgi:N-acetylneuraminic acid mutarotase
MIAPVRSLVFPVAFACLGLPLACIGLASCGDKVTPFYDAGATGSWSQDPSSPRPRAFGASGASGGRLYVVGGMTGGKGVDWVDVYDPVTRVWSEGPPLPAGAPLHHIALATSGDKLYVLGGFTDFGDGFAANAGTYVLDGATWRPVATQPVFRGGATAQGIDGKIYVAGGGDDDTHARLDVYAYDVAADQWLERPNMPTERQDAASCVIGGKFVVIGGRLSDGRADVASTQVYDPATSIWTIAEDMPTPRSGLAATTIGDTCFAIGGEQPNASGGALSTVEGFSFASGWLSYADLPTPRRGLGAASLGGQIYAALGDGTKAGAVTGALEVFTLSP